MRPIDRLTLGLAAALALIAGPSARAEEAHAAASAKPAGNEATNVPEKAGDSPAFRTLADLPVLHVEPEGSRIKPLDTFSRLVVKEIYGRESIKLTTPDGEESRRPGRPSVPSSTGRSTPLTGTVARSS